MDDRRPKIPLASWIGMILVSSMLILSYIGPLLSPYSETAIVGSLWESPSARFWLGTDHLGRDMLTRLMYGGRMTVNIALAATLLGFLVGATLGFLAAVRRGWADEVLSRLVDVIMSFPTLILALLVLTVLGSSIPLLIVVIAVVHATRVFRISRSLGGDIMAFDFIEVARLRGEGLAWVIGREILPNALPPLVAELGMRFSFACLFVSSLSFLGLGVQPPSADWGGMVGENAQAITFGITAPLYPAACIALLTIGTNLLVDWILTGSLSAGRRRDA